MTRGLRFLLPPVLTAMGFLVTAAAALADSDLPHKESNDTAGAEVAVVVLLIVAAVIGVSAVTLWRLRQRSKRPRDEKEGD